MIDKLLEAVRSHGIRRPRQNSTAYNCVFPADKMQNVTPVRMRWRTSFGPVVDGVGHWPDERITGEMLFTPSGGTRTLLP